MKKLLTLIIISLGLLIAVTSIVIIVFFNKDSSIRNSELMPTPTKYPVFHDKILRKNIPYNNDSQRRLIQIATNRPALSTAGQTLRQQQIGYLNNTTGTLRKTDAYNLEYILSADVFMAEIKSSNIEETKLEVADYLISLGFTDSDICRLPLVFYLNSIVAQQLRDTTIEFNPLPIGC